MPESKPDDYRSYLLRMWRTRDNDTFHWRASLEQVGIGERVVFDRLEALIAYLNKLDETPDMDEGHDLGQSKG